jgi:hypothetical protein
MLRDAVIARRHIRKARRALPPQERPSRRPFGDQRELPESDLESRVDEEPLELLELLELDD